jgi:oxygen-independent coproporphyrinogen-3 oxidase
MEMGETMMMGLRLDTGVGEEEFLARFGESFWDVFGDTIPNMVNAGLLDVGNRRLKLTDRGRLLGNEVFRLFVA